MSDNGIDQSFQDFKSIKIEAYEEDDSYKEVTTVKIEPAVLIEYSDLEMQRKKNKSRLSLKG